MLRWTVDFNSTNFAHVIMSWMPTTTQNFITIPQGFHAPICMKWCILGFLFKKKYFCGFLQLSDSHAIIQHMRDDLNTKAAKVGLCISCEKTKAMFVGELPTMSISVGSNLLQSVENFQYLGSYISNQSDIEVDIRARLGKAALVFLRLNRIWSSHSINSTIKFRLYTSIVLSRALHACETWKSTASIRNTLDVFHSRCIWKILGLSWQDCVTNEELMTRSGMQDLSETVQTWRLRLAGHVLRLPDVRPACVAMTWIPESGGRTRGRLHKPWGTSFNF